MRILVICGAGASSTFVAQRVRRAASEQGLDYSAVAGTEQSLATEIGGVDVVLVGPHLGDALERIERDAAASGASVVLLPPDIFGDTDGSRTLALIQAALESPVDTTSPARITHAD